MNILAKFAGAAIICAAPTTSFAQSTPYSAYHQNSEPQVSAAFTIPLGHSSDERRTVPRFEIITRARIRDNDLNIVARHENYRWHERRIGLTLDGRQQLMINGTPLSSARRRSNLGTTETVLLVGGAVIIGGAVAMSIWLNDEEFF